MYDADRVPVNWERVRPRLSVGVRLAYDHVRGQMALHPEGVAFLNTTAGTTLALLDGSTSVAGIIATLAKRFRGVRQEELCSLLGSLRDARLVEVGPPGANSPPLVSMAAADTVGPADVTPRCQADRPGCRGTAIVRGPRPAATDLPDRSRSAPYRQRAHQNPAASDRFI